MPLTFDQLNASTQPTIHCNYNHFGVRKKRLLFTREITRRLLSRIYASCAFETRLSHAQTHFSNKNPPTIIKAYRERIVLSVFVISYFKSDVNDSSCLSTI